MTEKVVSLPTHQGRGRRPHPRPPTVPKRPTKVTLRLTPDLQALLERLKAHYGQLEYAPVLRVALMHLARSIDAGTPPEGDAGA